MFAMITLIAHLQTTVFIPNSRIMLLKLTVTDKLLRNFPSQELHSSKFVCPPIYSYQCPYSLTSCKSIKIQAMECNVDGFGLRLCHKNETVLKSFEWYTCFNNPFTYASNHVNSYEFACSRACCLSYMPSFILSLPHKTLVCHAEHSSLNMFF